MYTFPARVTGTSDLRPGVKPSDVGTHLQLERLLAQGRRLSGEFLEVGRLDVRIDGRLILVPVLCRTVTQTGPKKRKTLCIMRKKKSKRMET
jgi:hypothetical protein